jgi:hypothetical protein
MVKRRVTGQLTKVIFCHSSQSTKKVLPMFAVGEELTIEGGRRNNSQGRMYPSGLRLGKVRAGWFRAGSTTSGTRAREEGRDGEIIDVQFNQGVTMWLVAMICLSKVRQMSLVCSHARSWWLLAILDRKLGSWPGSPR